MGWFFAFFFVSGFCSILYEIIWLRLAMAQFGVTTPLVSIVLSLFMAGLGLGAWGAGHLINKWNNNTKLSPLQLYAITELLIAFSAILVPIQLSSAGSLIDQLSLASSFGYYLISALMMLVILVPWCACMGATIPIAMMAIAKTYSTEKRASFSFLYLANLLGALLGTFIPLILIEMYGFRHALWIGAVLNALLFLFAMGLSFTKHQSIAINSNVTSESETQVTSDLKTLYLLFLSGLTCMGIEIIWIRLYTPYLGTVVYSFSAILGIYLAATYLGSLFYRYLRNNIVLDEKLIWIVLTVSILLPLTMTNANLKILSAFRVLVGVLPLSFMLGLVTPYLVDRWSHGDPKRAGKAYAINVLGCIIGPLISGFLLLPHLSEQWTLVFYALPWLTLSLFSKKTTTKAEYKFLLKTFYIVLLAILPIIVFKAKVYEDRFSRYEIRRDNTATIIATGEGMGKHLYVNGIGITTLTPITKIMAHLPLAFLSYQPKSALVICFGMGTTFRSLLSWNIKTTAVELVSSVPSLFWYYHADARQLLQSPLANIIIDDGRRYLMQSKEKFDVITIDPPPPIQAAASSLLYSKEFYAIIKKRLQPNGIVQQWIPNGDAETLTAVARALFESFQFVRIFQSPDNEEGLHFLASQHPIPYFSAAELVAHMPPKAVVDLTEWNAIKNGEVPFSNLLKQERSIGQLLALSPKTPALQDDRPINEYYLLRNLIHN